MNLPGFYALSGAWLFLLVIPLVLFYFLKLKRPQMQIPSLALWRQVINDRRVNSPFQKFKRNLLLLLQLLLLICLVLAAMQPFLPSGAERAEYLPVLIDCSASMAAADEPEGWSRLEAAKDQVGELIDNLLPDQRLSLIAVHSSARRLTDFTSNKRVLRDALEKIRVTQVESEIEDALRMAQALSRTVPIETVVLLSDGNVPPQVNFELPFQVNYQRLGSRSRPPDGTSDNERRQDRDQGPAGPSGPTEGDTPPNIGITALNGRRIGSKEWDVFVRVAGSESRQTAGDLELVKDGTPVGEETIVLEPGESSRLAFSVAADGPSSLEVRLKPDGFDALDADNTAYLDLPAGRPLAVYCPLELSSYRHALRGLEGVDVFPREDRSPLRRETTGGRSPEASDDRPPQAPPSQGRESSVDVLITDRPDDPGRFEAAVTLLVGVVPDELQKLVEVETGSAEVVDWQRTAPLLQHVQLIDVIISDEPKSTEGTRDGDFEQLGYEILAHGRTGPLILKQRDGQRLRYVLLFHTDRSTLPYRVGFPILVSNLVQIGLQSASLSEVRAASTGVLPPVSVLPNVEAVVTGPERSTVRVQADDEGVVSGIAAPEVGRYVIRQEGAVQTRIGASLLSSRETSLAGVDRIQFRELSVSVAEGTIQSDRPLWRAFALIAFGLLLGEWWYFQRRPGGVPP